MSPQALKSQNPKRSREVLPLQQGDHLTRDEFEKRYNATDGIKRAELIEGRVYVSPPVSFGSHGNPHFSLIGWLAAYAVATPGVLGGDNASLRLDLKNMPQPDAFLIIEPSRGGQATISDDDYVEGAPELVVEVAASSASYDLHDKFEVFVRNRVREYIIWQTKETRIDYFSIENDAYQPHVPDANGCYRSIVFPGLWLDSASLINGDLVKVHNVLKLGLASPEHAAFVAKLAAAAKS
jgi:Uma2 family endonuclease